MGKDLCIKDPSLVQMIDNFDRPGKAFAAGSYSGAGTFGNECENKPGKRVPKAGAYAAAGTGYARAEWGVFDAEARGPNAGAGAGVSLASGARAFAKAEVGSASVKAGPVKATVGLSADTGVSVGPSGVEVQVLGTGVAFGPRMRVALFGNAIEFDL